MATLVTFSEVISAIENARRLHGDSIVGYMLEHVLRGPADYEWVRLNPEKWTEILCTIMTLDAEMAVHKKAA